ncbi:MAG: 2-dehydropantoate 2-reductase [Candidatus Omnitrophota bacterium]
MKITVIGAGAIGGLVGGYLKLKDEDVSLVARKECLGVIKENGLTIQGARGAFNVKIDASERLNEKPGLVILATKTQDLKEAIEENFKFIKDAQVLTTQNGVRAEEITAQFIPRENIISSIVMFGATSLEPGKIVHNFEGSWLIARAFSKNDASLSKIGENLNRIFPILVTEKIKGMKYLKVFVNANNCIPAILGLSMQEAFSDPALSRISIAIWREGLDIVTKSGIELISLPDFPVERVTKLTGLPQEEAAKIFSGIMANLSKEPLYGSILQSIKRNKPSEIDFINGEFVDLAKNNHLASPLNEKLLELVHQVEKTKEFLSKEQLISLTKGLYN